MTKLPDLTVLVPLNSVIMLHTVKRNDYNAKRKDYNVKRNDYNVKRNDKNVKRHE